MTQDERTDILDGLTNSEKLEAEGLLVYQTDPGTNPAGFYYYDGSGWKFFGGGGADNDWIIDTNDMHNENTGNVGVGNTAPSAKFHIKGTYEPGSSGGLTTLYANDFSSGSLNNTLNPGNDCIISPYIWNIQSGNNFYASCSTCTGDRAYIRSFDKCTQNQTFTEGTFNPTSTSINVSFNYGFKDYRNGSLFKVILYNETTGSPNTLLELTSSAQDTSYTGSHTVVAGNTYSLKFSYVGDNDYGAAVDDILVTETGSAVEGSYVFRLEDNQQGAGKVLTSDEYGNATWKAYSSGGRLSSNTKQQKNKSNYDDSFEQQTTAVILKQQSRIEQLKTQISELKNLTNKLIKNKK
jgi:hypothetical protein